MATGRRKARNGSSTTGASRSAPAEIEVYWFDDHRGVRLPKACRLKYWDGEQFVPVKNAKGLGLAANQFNTTTFAEVRNDAAPAGDGFQRRPRPAFSSGGCIDSGHSPAFPPRGRGGLDRAVVLPGKTCLSGTVRDGQAGPSARRDVEQGVGAGRGAYSTNADAAADHRHVLAPRASTCSS